MKSTTCSSKVSRCSARSGRRSRRWSRHAPWFKSERTRKSTFKRWRSSARRPPSARPSGRRRDARRGPPLEATGDERGRASSPAWLRLMPLPALSHAALPCLPAAAARPRMVTTRPLHPRAPRRQRCAARRWLPQDRHQCACIAKAGRRRRSRQRQLRRLQLLRLQRTVGTSLVLPTVRRHRWPCRPTARAVHTAACAAVEQEPPRRLATGECAAVAVPSSAERSCCLWQR
mmetsp:Transcript_6185/g.19709  ORF Transcript_6185/g.19709 Transcript_6185/m.19709 type:complete len:231 (+) Transcript_6185:252-944(+)